MPRELEMETVTIYCLQSHSGDIFIVLSWAESRAPVAPGYNDPSGHLTWPGYWAGALVCYLLPYLHHIVVWKNYTCLYHLPVGSHFYISKKYACNKNQARPWLAQVLLVTMQMWSSEVMRGDARQGSVQCSH